MSTSSTTFTTSTNSIKSHEGLAVKNFLVNLINKGVGTKLHDGTNVADGFNLTFQPGTPIYSDNSTTHMTLESPLTFMATYGMVVRLTRSDNYAELNDDTNYHTEIFVVGREQTAWSTLRKALYNADHFEVVVPAGTKIKINGIPILTCDETSVKIPIDAKFDIVSAAQLHPIGADNTNDLLAISFGYTSKGDSYPFSFHNPKDLIERRDRAQKLADSKKEDLHISCAKSASFETLLDVIREHVVKQPTLMSMVTSMFTKEKKMDKGKEPATD